MTGQNSSELSAIQGIAKEYREKGYLVEVLPSRSKMPSFLKDYQVDLMAFGNGESVIVEIKRFRNEKSIKELQAISNIIDKEQDWRLDVVFLEDKEPEKYGVDNELISKELFENIGILLKEGRQNWREGRFMASWACLFLALESAIYGICQKEQIEYQNRSLFSILKELYFNGVFSSEEYDELSIFNDMKSFFVHLHLPEAAEFQFEAYERILNNLLKLYGYNK